MEKKITARKFFSFLFAFSSSYLFLSFSSLRKRTTRCQECRLASLEASRTLVELLLFPFSRPPPSRDDDEDDDVSFGCVWRHPLLREHIRESGLRERQERGRISTVFKTEVGALPPTFCTSNGAKLCEQLSRANSSL